MSANTEILTVGDVARELRCSKAHVYNVINGKVKNVSPLPSLTIGRRKLVRRSTLEEWKKVNEHRNSNAMILSPEIDAVGRREEKLHA